MKTQKTAELYDQNHAVIFYEDRYEQGYMDEWPVEQKIKVFEVIQDLNLPETGEALDFGCGNGVFTDIIRQALPLWSIYGTDISKKAVLNAEQRFPGCIFFEISTPTFSEKKFDFIFTNHVLEHVSNLSNAIDQIIGLLKPKSSMLHFLPCGNDGSYEHTICLLRKDGINKNMGNRFFFEDESHLRRLTTEELCELSRDRNFELTKEYYSYQYFGAIDWITASNFEFVRMFSSYDQAIDDKTKSLLKRVRVYLIILCFLRIPSQIVPKLLMRKDKQLRHYILLTLGIMCCTFSLPIDKYWKRKARKEWEQRKNDRRGSEMCLYFTKNEIQ